MRGVLVLDMQNDCIPKGAPAEVGEMARAIIPMLQKFLNAAREKGVPVIYELISEVVEIDDAAGRKGVSFQLEKITPVRGDWRNTPWQHYTRRRAIETRGTRFVTPWKPTFRKEHGEC
jgi:nicotinamidase-related amidase